MSDRSHLDKVKEAADPDRVISALGLKGKGRRFFCPSCQPDGGKTPDLAVKDGGFICHKCGVKGDLLKLIQVTKGLDFPSALRWLEDETGVQPPDRKGGKYPDKIKGQESSPGASLGPKKVIIPEDKSAPNPAVYEAFLSACYLVAGSALDWLVQEKGIAPSVIETLGLRLCSKEYPDIIDALKDRFGEDELLKAGLLKKSKADKIVPSFWHYFAQKSDFLVIPYLLGGRPVYLKTRPPCGKEKAESLGLVRFLNTAGKVPCLYNVDALAVQPVPDRVLICEGESDTWTALSYGFAAVGSPGANNFKPAWVEGFRGFVTDAIDEERAAILEFEGGLSREEAESRAVLGPGRSTVYLVLDADKAGEAGTRIIADLFQKAGLPLPLKLAIPEGKDLSEYMKGKDL